MTREVLDHWHPRMIERFSVQGRAAVAEFERFILDHISPEVLEERRSRKPRLLFRDQITGLGRGGFDVDHLIYRRDAGLSLSVIKK